MCGDHNALMRRVRGFENDVAAFLVDDTVAPLAAKHFYQTFAAQVARNLHV